MRVMIVKSQTKGQSRKNTVVGIGCAGMNRDRDNIVQILVLSSPPTQYCHYWSIHLFVSAQACRWNETVRTER